MFVPVECLQTPAADAFGSADDHGDGNGKHECGASEVSKHGDHLVGCPQGR